MIPKLAWSSEYYGDDMEHDRLEGVQQSTLNFCKLVMRAEAERSRLSETLRLCVLTQHARLPDYVRKIVFDLAKPAQGAYSVTDIVVPRKILVPRNLSACFVGWQQRSEKELILSNKS